ncbi:MAG TPA: hypothetical protein VMW49_06445 [Candidatus Dormibacteraeota bacterium]|nr:hypothetical protein [Candidatus Dormibacteraeota bacterium]
MAPRPRAGARAQTATLITTRKVRVEALVERWLGQFSALLAGYPADFQPFCTPEVVRTIAHALHPFLVSGDKFTTRVDDATTETVGLDVATAPVEGTFVFVDRSQRVTADNHRLLPHPDDPDPLRIRLTVLTDPSITWIESLRVELAEPTAPGRPRL